MKKSILAVVLSIAMLVTCVLPAFAEEDKWTWADDGYTVAQYAVDIVDEGTINVDAKLDDAYLNSTKIVSPENGQYLRSPDSTYAPIQEYNRGTFYAYIVIDTAGMYIFCDIDDITVYETLNSNCNDGDGMQIYFDWTPAEYMHPTPEARTEMEAAGNKWEANVYKSTYGSGLSGMQYLGWLAGDYTGVVGGSAGFAPHDQIGENFEGIQYATGLREGGWVCEFFVPWRDGDQKAAIAKGEQFHCSIGFQCNDDADINDECSPGTEKNTSVWTDQRIDLGLSYYADYSMLADLVWDGSVEGGDDIQKPGENPPTSDSVIAVVAAIAVAGAGLAFFSKKREG